MTDLSARLHDLLCTRHCAMCGERLSSGEHALCSVCNACLPRTGYDASPADNDMAHMFWGRIPIERCGALFFYKGGSGASQLVYDLKYNDSPVTAEALGAMLATEYGAASFFDGIDVIVPVPLSRDRIRERGYNQSVEIARGISHVTGIAVDAGAVGRMHFESSQTHKQRWDRNDNVAHVFRAIHPERLSHRHILLVDDVATTGATLCACAKEIEKAGDVTFSILTLGFVKA